MAMNSATVLTSNAHDIGFICLPAMNIYWLASIRRFAFDPGSGRKQIVLSDPILTPSAVRIGPPSRLTVWRA
jgi:hypothetical protein